MLTSVVRRPLGCQAFVAQTLVCFLSRAAPLHWLGRFGPRFSQRLSGCGSDSSDPGAFVWIGLCSRDLVVCFAGQSTNHEITRTMNHEKTQRFG